MSDWVSPPPPFRGEKPSGVKLATELSKRSTGSTIYILDEPTTGLHVADVHKLVEVLGSLVDAGNTVVVIEHNLDVIKCADYIIDLGPEGGEKGGMVICTGTPEEVANVEGLLHGPIPQTRVMKILVDADRLPGKGINCGTGEGRGNQGYHAL